MNLFKKMFLSKPIFTIVLITILFGAIVTSTIMVGNVIIEGRHKAELVSLNAIINTLEIEKEQYHEQIVSFIKKQSEIRSYINELVALLYARESSLGEGVGGSGEAFAINEQTPLFQLKQAINELNDDEQAMKMVRDYLVSRRNFAESFPFIWPVKGGVPRISSGYGVRSNEEVGSVLGRPKQGIHFHAGIDIPGKLADPILATADGRVAWIDLNNKVYGAVVVIQHNYGFQTLYGHCNKVIVKVGQYIKRGDIIAYMGNTGASYGVHLHYEIKKDGYHIDPMDLLGLNM